MENEDLALATVEEDAAMEVADSGVGQEEVAPAGAAADRVEAAGLEPDGLAWAPSGLANQGDPDMPHLKQRRRRRRRLCYALLLLSLLVLALRDGVVGGSPSFESSVGGDG